MRIGENGNTVASIQIPSGKPSLTCDFCKMTLRLGIAVDNSDEEYEPVLICKVCLETINKELDARLEQNRRRPGPFPAPTL